MSAPNQVLFGAALTFAEKETGSYLTEKTSNPTLTTTAQQIVEPNADRLELIVFNLGAQDAYIHFDPAVSATFGFKIVNSGGFVIFKLRDDLTLLTRPFYGIAASATTQITVAELVRIVGQPLGYR